MTAEATDGRSAIEIQEIAELEKLFADGFGEIDKVLGTISSDVDGFQKQSKTFTYRPSGYLRELNSAFDSQKETVEIESTVPGGESTFIEEQTLDAEFMANVTGIVTRLDTENEQNKFLIGVLQEKDKLLNDVINNASSVNMIVSRMQRVQSLVNKKNVEMQVKIMKTLNNAIAISQRLYENTNIISTQFANLFSMMSTNMTEELKNYRVRMSIAMKISNQRVKSINTDINYVTGALKATQQILNNDVRSLILDVKHQQDSAIQAAGHLTQLKLRRLSGALFSDKPTYKNVIDGAGTSVVIGLAIGVISSKIKQSKIAKAKFRFTKGAF